MSQPDFSTIIGAVILAASNLGAAKLLLVRSLSRQDEMDKKLQAHSELLSVSAETQRSTVETLAKVQDSVAELYESRNRLEIHANGVELLHDFKGCKILNQGPKGQ